MDLLTLRPVAFDHPDAVKLTAEVQQEYVHRYGGQDATPIDASQFAPPLGYFLVGYMEDQAVACAGWRAHDSVDGDAFRDGDVELKRMYATLDMRGRGFAKAILTALEQSAVAAGRRRCLLETGTKQPEAIGLYLASGYTEIPSYGYYRDSPTNRCFAKDLS